MLARCTWCGCVFAARQSGGSPQQFCSAAHRRAFWQAASAYAAWLLRTNQITIEAIKVHSSSAGAAPEAQKPIQDRLVLPQ